MARLQKNDILFAHMALHLVPDLSAAARRVGAGILEHFNKKTGQCDPSVERLARMLGIDRATVLRGTAELCRVDAYGKSVGLFERVTHGGRSHRTAYLPRWDRLNAVIDDWDRRMKSGGAPEKVAKLRRSKSQSCDVDSRNLATQTVRRNRHKEPTAAVSLSDHLAETPSQRDCRNGLRTNECPAGPLVPTLPMVAGRRGAAKADAAEGAAHRQLAARIARLPKHEREAAWLAAMEARPAR